MRLTFLALPADERRLYIEQAAIRRNASPVVLEKDFMYRGKTAWTYRAKLAAASATTSTSATP